MNCPVCGAENEVGARFCTECGAPLENTLNLPTTPPEVEGDDDRTILSTNLSRLAEEAKTVTVTQEQMAAAEAEAASSGSSAFEPASSPVSPVSGGSSGGQGWMTRRNLIIIGVVVVLLLLCCCCSLVAGGILADPEIMKQLEDLGMRPALTMLI